MFDKAHKSKTKKLEDPMQQKSNYPIFITMLRIAPGEKITTRSICSSLYRPILKELYEYLFYAGITKTLHLVRACNAPFSTVEINQSPPNVKYVPKSKHVL